MKLSGWGKNIVRKCKVVKPKTLLTLKKEIGENCIARGMGRSYGDSSLQPNKTIVMTNFSKINKFDYKKGIITVEAGITLENLLKVIIPKGWFVPVSPGTKFVTVGGMIASNVHGKNHHNSGGFENHLVEIKVIDENKNIRKCSLQKEKVFFLGTCGGMGLTGVIIEATIKLKKIETPYIEEKIICTKGLEDTIKKIGISNKYHYSIAWIDCAAKNKNFGRAVIFCGEHVKKNILPKNLSKLEFKKKKKFNIFFSLPRFIFNGFFIRIFNILYYYSNYLKQSVNYVDYDKFFYPLDSLLNWNSLYGNKGFIQYQCVVPKKIDIMNILKIFKYSDIKSFLVTLKILKKDKGLLSFPIKGYTLAFDVPYSQKNSILFSQLNKQVLKSKGKIYLTKDSLMNASFFKSTYKNIAKFKKTIRNKKNKKTFSSMQSNRLEL